MKTLAAGQRADMGQLAQSLSLAGYIRTGTVMEAGEYAVRGGILDLFSPGRQTPVRLDFFGDTIESIKSFDIETQRTSEARCRSCRCCRSPRSRSARARRRMFRKRYVELFGGATGNDPLYESVSAGHRHPGQEHWLPFFHDKLETLFDYVPGAQVSFDHQSEESSKEPLRADHRALRRARGRPGDAVFRRAAL